MQFKSAKQMLGKSHQLVANLALANLEQKERHILYPRWGGIETGATLSDEYRIMWEPIEAGSQSKQLVHRCWIDSDNIKDHGCVTRANDHAEGAISFIKDHLGELDDEEKEVDFLENLGMFLGIASHHIADLCTPVHVGHQINYMKLGYQSLSKFHAKVERDIFRYQNKSSLYFSKPRIINLSSNYFWDIANNTYANVFQKLESIYLKKDPDRIIEMSSLVISEAVMHTRDV